MPRTTIDFHDDREDAVSALTSLREVGLNPNDVASAWLAPREGEFVGEPPVSRVDLYEANIDGMGPVQLSGWFAEAALSALSSGGAIALNAVVDGQGDGKVDLDRVRQTLASGGGVVGVRARDAYSTGAA